MGVSCTCRFLRKYRLARRCWPVFSISFGVGGCPGVAPIRE